MLWSTDNRRKAALITAVELHAWCLLNLSGPCNSLAPSYTAKAKCDGQPAGSGLPVIALQR